MTSQLRQIALVLFLLSLGGGGARAQQTLNNVPAELVGYPDLIIFNGKIVTMDDVGFNTSPGRIVQGLAVRGDKILALGTSDAIQRLAGPQTQKIDLKGRTVVPGWINTHTHYHNGIISRWANSNLDKTEDIAKRFSVTGKDFAEINKGIELIVKERMANPLPDQWALISVRSDKVGTDWMTRDNNKGTSGMTRAQLDALAPTLPIAITGYAGSYFINTAARNAFLAYYATEPTDENERLSITVGTVFGRALIVDRYFETHMKELEDVLEEGLQQLPAGGYTTYSSHIVGLRFGPAFRQLVVQGRMPVRFAWTHRLCQMIEPDMEGCFLRVGDLQGMSDKGSYFWNIGMTLGAIDLTGPEICTSIDAAPEEKKKELCYLAPENELDYRKAVYAAYRNRYRYVANHVYGDRAFDYLMDIMEQVMKDNPDITLDFMRSMRITGDHCSFYPRKDQIPRMKNLGMMVSCGPPNAGGPEDRRKTVYGEQYLNRNSPAMSLIKGGVMLTAETEGVGYADNKGPTVPALLHRFLTRKNSQGQVIAPEEIIDRVHLMKMMTTWPSYYVLREQEIGSLEPGKLADFLILNKDYFTVPLEEIPTVYPLMTVIGGKTVVLREEFGRELGKSPVGPQIAFSFEVTGGQFGGE